MNDEKHVDFAALKYYDERNKQYIDTKVNTINSELKDVERRVDSLEATMSGHTEQLIAHREELDDLEARVVTLERDDVSIRKDIADLRVAIETNGNGTGTGVSKDYVDNRIEEAIESLNIPDTSDFVTKSDFADATEDFVTESQITELTNTVAGNQVAIEELQENKANKSDLVGLATEEFVLKKIAEAELADQDVDLSVYYTKSETDAKIQEAVDTLDIPDVSGFATKEEVKAVEAKIDAIVIPEVPTKVSELENDANYATKEYVNNFFEDNIEIVIPDLSNYVTEEELQSAINNIPQPDLSDYAKKTDIPSVEGLATEKFVSDKIAEIVVPEVPTKISELENDTGYITAEDIPETDLSNYYNKTETENLISEAVKDIEHPTVDLEGYATEEWVNAQGFLKEHQDLSDYAKKSDIPEAELFIVDYNAPDFAAALEAYNNGKLLLLTNAAPDGNGYAVMNYVRADMITFTKFLMSRSETYGAFNTYYLHSDNTWELAKEVKLNKVDAVVDGNNDITGLTIGKNTYEFDNFATNETVEQINQNIENIENTYVTNETLSKNYITEEQIANTYVTEEHVSNTYITVQDAADTYVTNEKVTEVVTQEVETVVTEQIETKVTEVIEQKIESGDINVNADAINYDTW